MKEGTRSVNSKHPSELASRPATRPVGRADAGSTAVPLGGMMPLAGLMVQPFPEPGKSIKTAMEQLQYATIEPPADETALRELAQMPRPWDPGSCTGQMRRELWTWLDRVAMWVNEEHLWSVNRPGIPECWPAHPHIVHDLAVLACSRYYTSFAVTPAVLEDWHRYGLPGFLERLRDRLGDGCQPGKHQPRPRQERDEKHAATPVRAGRKQRYQDDVDKATGRSTGKTTRAASEATSTLPNYAWASGQHDASEAEPGQGNPHEDLDRHDNDRHDNDDIHRGW